MTVIYYGEGEHPAGFVGYRVARTIGVDTEYRQKYFSLNVYSAAVAFEKAHKLDREWKEEAESIKREGLMIPSVSTVNHIVTGFRAYAQVEKNSTSYSFRPYFCVARIGYGLPDMLFNMNKLGYRKAYIEASKAFSKTHDLTLCEYDKLLDMMPCRDALASYFVGALMERGYCTKKSSILLKMPLSSA
jgi:hypothetical protein